VKVMEWNKRSRDWDWHETYSPQWHAKEKVIELGKYDSKGKKVTESIESVNEDPTQLAHDVVTSAQMMKGAGIATGMAGLTVASNAASRAIQKKIGQTVDKIKDARKRNKPVFAEPIPRDSRVMKTIGEDAELDAYNKTGWGTKETTKRWVDSTPGQVMPDVKSTPKSKTRTRKHPGNEVSDAGGMGEGALKRGLLPSQDNFGPGMSKADHSNAKVSPTTYKKKPDDLITKIKGARKSAKVLLKGSKND